MEPVTVFRTFNPAEAELVCSRLNAGGLHAEVVHGTAALAMEGYSMATGGILIQVPDSEASEARELVAAKDAE